MKENKSAIVFYVFAGMILGMIIEGIINHFVIMKLLGLLIK